MVEPTRPNTHDAPPPSADPFVPMDTDGLDQESYTAQRLEHGTPYHIHLTSRRCFIGPIPEAWLSKHRKSWYKYRPHLSTYSSRTATFDASANVVNSKQLTGLDRVDGVSGSGGYHGPSFPQPVDIAEDAQVDGASEQVEEAVEPEQPPKPGLSLQVPGPGRAKKVSFGNEPRHQDAKEEANPAANGLNAGKNMHASGMSGRSDAAQTFVTAEESLGKSDSKENSTGTTAGANSTIAPTSSLDTGNMRYSIPETPEAFIPSLSGARPSVNSSSSLLHREVSDSRRESTIPQADAASEELDLRDPISEPAVETGPSNGTQEAPASVDKRPRAHFDIPDINTAEPVQRLESLATWALHGFQGYKTRPGQLAKAERMLVKVDWTMQSLPAGYMENDSLKTETKAVDKWREYMVVCRQSSGAADDPSFVLQFNKSRVIPLLDQNRTSKKVAHEICLDRNFTGINLYSSLDKSIVLWAPYKKTTRIYILKARSSTSAVEWYTFLNSILGWRRPTTLKIHVPDLNVTLDIDNPFRALQRTTKEILDDDAQDSSKAFDALVEETVAKDIIAKCTDMLLKSSGSLAADSWLERGQKIGLAWKRYDRLEWVHGVNEKRMYGTMAMQKTHDLEIRPKQHYPTNAYVDGRHEQPMEEPAAVEGFLVRLTSQKGRHSRYGKSFFKRLYFSTHNQYLCFCAPSKAMPPKPPQLRGVTGKLPKASEVAAKIPIVYAVNPYPFESGNISWLASGAKDSRKELDQAAYAEAERITKTLLDSQGYINLCNVQKVRRFRKDREPSSGSQLEDVPEESEEGEIETENSQSADEARTFELVLANGLTVRLQAYDQTTRKEWVRRLRKLTAYWKSRITEDMDTYKTVRQANLERLEIDEEMESILGQFADKWEVSRAVASPELFNMCGISLCRTITMAGMLYRKPRLHSTFRRNLVILCHGKLLIFQSSLRRQSGKEIPHIHHERKEVIDLKDTYVYSGLITDGDLLYHNQTFDSNHPGHHALPRIYLEDAWTSCDEDTMTCFVIWHGKSKSFFKARAESQQENNGHKTRQRLRYVSSLGKPGRSVVFKTRSRAERDHWVMSIHGEIERLQLDEDIRVVSSTPTSTSSAK